MEIITLASSWKNFIEFLWLENSRIDLTSHKIKKIEALYFPSKFYIVHHCQIGIKIANPKAIYVVGI